MQEFCVVARSVKAPIVSNTSIRFIDAESTEEALAEAERRVFAYKVHTISVYTDANAYHKGLPPLVTKEY